MGIGLLGRVGERGVCFSGGGMLLQGGGFESGDTRRRR